MTVAMYHIHMTFGLAMAIYFAFPLVAAWLRGKPGSQQAKVLRVMNIVNRIGQFLLIVQFLSGGMIMTQAKYTVAWMIIVTVLLVVIGAFTGMMGKPLKQWIESADDANGQSAASNKVLMFSALNALAYAAILYFMYHPSYVV